MDGNLRGDNRNDPIVARLMEQPAIRATLESRHPELTQEVQAQIQAAIESTDDRKLCGWVAVAVWDNPVGKVSQTLIGDGESSFLEMKGYLHDAVWTAAHAD